MLSSSTVTHLESWETRIFVGYSYTTEHIREVNVLMTWCLIKCSLLRAEQLLSCLLISLSDRELNNSTSTIGTNCQIQNESSFIINEMSLYSLLIKRVFMHY